MGEEVVVHKVAGIVIPAHNEEKSISRLLEGLVGNGVSFHVVVVCNGCIDLTARLARRFEPDVSVLEIEQASKSRALVEGDKYLGNYPRIIVDADVQIGSSDVQRLVEVLDSGVVLACAPKRILARSGTSWIVRSYYDVWEMLPQVRCGLFGRGVIALSREGVERVRRLPAVMADDLVVSEAFTTAEKRVVEEATVVVNPPRNVRDLIRRRTRAITGNFQADSVGLRSDSARTTMRSLMSVVITSPRLISRVPVFMVVTVVARVAARKAIHTRDFETWRRDDSSRE